MNFFSIHQKHTHTHTHTTFRKQVFFRPFFFSFLFLSFFLEVFEWKFLPSICWAFWLMCELRLCEHIKKPNWPNRQAKTCPIVASMCRYLRWPIRLIQTLDPMCTLCMHAYCIYASMIWLKKYQYWKTEEKIAKKLQKIIWWKRCAVACYQQSKCRTFCRWWQTINTNHSPSFHLRAKQTTANSQTEIQHFIANDVRNAGDKLQRKMCTKRTAHKFVEFLLCNLLCIFFLISILLSIQFIMMGDANAEFSLKQHESKPGKIPTQKSTVSIIWI